MLTEFNGLPLHPLLVHAVVVLLPLATLGALLVAARPRWAPAYAPLVAALAVVGFASAYLSREAGEALEQTLRAAGDPLEGIEEHGRWGLYVVVLGFGFALAAVAAAVLGRRGRTGGRLHLVLAWLTTVLGVAATVFTVMAGETGAESVWGYVFAG